MNTNQVESSTVIIEDPTKSVMAESIEEDKIDVDSTDIITQLIPGTLIKLRKKSNGIINNIVTNGEQLRLAADRIYYIPITNKKLRKNDMNVIRAESKVGEEMLILNVENGFACIKPLYNNLVIKNNMKLGICI